MRGAALVLLLGAEFLGLWRAGAQEVVSASAGVVQYFEGVVLIDGQQLERKAGAFPSLKTGATLRTEKGRAELLLTPGAFLRIDENSSVRMVSNSLADTRIELVTGSSIFENPEAAPDTNVALLYKGSRIRFPKPGIYRVDCELGELEAYRGEAEVTQQGESVSVDASHLYYFTLGMRTTKFGDGEMDEFYDWARNRSETIAQENQLAAAGQGDPGDVDPNGNGGVIVVPSPSVPVYTAPSAPYSVPGTFADSFYAYSPAWNFGYAPFPSVILLYPYRYWHRPGTSKWPLPPKSISRPSTATAWWPTRQGVNNIPRTNPLYFPLRSGFANGGYYRPVGPTLARPSSVAVPHVSIPRSYVPHTTSVPHVNPVHVGVHR